MARSAKSARSKKSVKKKAPRKATKKSARTSSAPSTKSRTSGTRARTARSSRQHIRPGVITHTELASADPEATRAWCATVLGWQFGTPMPTPAGPYHMWRFPNETGGGIRANNPPETPGSIPYCEVENIQATFSEALAAGAQEMLEPIPLPDGMGWIAIVAAPGNVPIGFWSMG